MMRKSIFFDPTGKRARLFGRFLWVFGTFSTVVIAAFTALLVTAHHPADQGLDGLDAAARSFVAAQALPVTPVGGAELPKPPAQRAKDLRDRTREVAVRPQLLSGPERHPLPAALARPKNRALGMGFYVNWDDNSFTALKRALPHLDWIFPGWFSLQGQSLELKTDIDQRALDYIRATKPGVAILPMIQNVFDGHWDGPGLARFLADPAARADRLNKIIAVLESNKFQGLTVDFEDVPPDAHKDLQIFLSELSSAFSEHGLAVVLAVPFDDDAWPYATYASIADFLLLMGYDEHWEEGEAGSLAGQSWFEDVLDRRMQTLDPDRTIVALGGYGRDWIQGQPAEDITFEDAFLSARTHQAKVAFDPESENTHFSFIAENGKRHDVWLLDGVTAFNQIHAADIYRPAGYALWRMGAEDPSVWSVFGRPYGAAAPERAAYHSHQRGHRFRRRGRDLAHRRDTH